MKKILLFLTLCFSLITLAQQQELKGVVLDNATSTPIADVVVSVANGSQITRTDSEGKFLLKVLSKKVDLLFAGKNHESRTISVKLPQAQILTFTLASKIFEIEEVTLSTGYQKIAKERATGSFSSVDSPLLQQQITTNVIDRLQAVASGVLMSKGTGSTQLMVRGLSSINGPKAPLIILDNFPYEGDINNINPNTVENITVLKDAAASSIWGARAANGVIVISTKTASLSQKVRLDFTANTTISPKPDLNYLKALTSSDFIDVEKELFNRGFYKTDINSPTRPVLSPVVSLLNKEKNGLISPETAAFEINRLRSVDTRDQYRKYMYQPAVKRQYFINMSDATPKLSWLSSLGYDDNKGSLDEGYQRLNLRVQNIWKPLSKLTLNTSAYLTRTANQSGRIGYGAITMKNNAVPYMEFADDNGNALAVSKVYDQTYKNSLIGKGLLDWNYYPLTDWKHSTSKSTATEVIINSAVNYKFFKGLDADLLYQYQWSSGHTDNLNDEQSYYTRNYINQFAQINANGQVSFIIPQGGILDKTNRLTNTNSLRGQLNYNQIFNKNRISALLGAETRSSNSKIEYNRFYGYNEKNLTTGSIDYTKQYPNFVTGSTGFIQRNQSLGEQNTRFVSLYANASYTYDGKYILSGSARRDASNLFGLNTNDQWNPFWSAGLAWDISKESFYNVSFLPFLKLRSSYGHSGNINPAMVAVTTIAYYRENSPYTNHPTARFDNYYNPSLKWENTRMENFALDFSTPHDRISGSVEYFTKKSDNLFGSTPIDYTTGIMNMLWNVAAMQGRGWDVELKTINIDKTFRWKSILNMSIYHDKVTQYYLNNKVARNFVQPDVSAYITGLEGMPVYSIFGYKWAGLDAQNGDPLGYFEGKISKNYAEILNADIKTDDLQYFGSAVPTHYGSFVNSFSYRNFSLDVGILYKSGYWFRRNSINYTALYNSWLGHKDYEERWQKSGDEVFTNVPSNSYVSNSNRDAFYNGAAILVEKGDHIRLQYINIAYNLPGDYWSKMPMKNLNLYFNVDNLGILWKANKAGIDPDYNITNTVLKPNNNFTLGLKANF